MNISARSGEGLELLKETLEELLREGQIYLERGCNPYDQAGENRADPPVRGGHPGGISAGRNFHLCLCASGDLSQGVDKQQRFSLTAERQRKFSPGRRLTESGPSVPEKGRKNRHFPENPVDRR